jgi:hypothetical protein
MLLRMLTAAVVRNRYRCILLRQASCGVITVILLLLRPLLPTTTTGPSVSTGPIPGRCGSELILLDLYLWLLLLSGLCAVVFVLVLALVTIGVM